MANESDLTTPEGRLRHARQRARFATAKDASDRYGWNQATYRAHENGERGFSRHVQMYSKAFKVPVEWLLTGAGDVEAYVDEEAAQVVRLMRKMAERDRAEMLEIARLKARKPTGTD